MNFRKDTKEYERRTDELDKVKIRCEWCGHRVIVPIKVKKRLCTWCGHWVFRDKKEQFKYKLKNAMKGNEKK